MGLEQCHRFYSDTQTRCGSVTVMVLVSSASGLRVSGCIVHPRSAVLSSPPRTFGRMIALIRKGDDTTTSSNGIETAGSGRFGFWLWPLVKPRPASSTLRLSQGRTRHPQPLRTTLRSRAPGQESRCASGCMEKVGRSRTADGHEGHSAAGAAKIPFSFLVG